MKQEACERLAKDADRRREKLTRKRELEILKQEEQCKEYFKPKINQKYHGSNIKGARKSAHPTNAYKTKVERFQFDAERRKSNKTNPSKMDDFQDNHYEDEEEL